MSSTRKRLAILAGALVASALPGSAWSSSHMDAPLITLDDPANTTDVYAFVSSEGGVDRQLMLLQEGAIDTAHLHGSGGIAADARRVAELLVAAAVRH